MRRRMFNTLRPIQRAEEGYTIHRQWDEKELFRTTVAAAAEAELKRLARHGHQSAYIKLACVVSRDEHSLFKCSHCHRGSLITWVQSDERKVTLKPRWSRRFQAFVDQARGW